MSVNLAERRQRRVRQKIRQQRNGRIRLSVFRSNHHIYAQLIDDVSGITIASASTLEEVAGKSAEESSGKKTAKAKAERVKASEAARLVGSKIAERGKQKNVVTVVFDRGRYIYHGRVKALADAARAGGLQF